MEGVLTAEWLWLHEGGYTIKGTAEGMENPQHAVETDRELPHPGSWSKPSVFGQRGKRKG